MFLQLLIVLFAMLYICETAPVTAKERKSILMNSDIAAVQERLQLLRSRSIQFETQEIIKETLNNNNQDFVAKERHEVHNGGESIQAINTRAKISKLLYQGDIVLTVDQADKIAGNGPSKTHRSIRQAYKDKSYPSTIWGSTVYYDYDTTATEATKSVFEKAVSIWHENTCIDFERNDTAPNRIVVIKGVGCYSYIGMLEGTQELSLGDGCESVGTAAHELGHALGFFHTQSRVDRDDYISVYTENALPDYVDQFNKETNETNYNYGIPYDYGSIMQYGALSASRNGIPTMMSNDSDYQDTMGSDMVAFYDISMMNEHYKCKDKCVSTPFSTICLNGGFPSSRKCSKCICPSGYEGDLCDQRPSGCGKVLNATVGWNSLNDTIGDGSMSLKSEFVKCNYWIQGPPNSTIEVKIVDFLGYYTDGCYYGGMEIKTHSDQKRTGYRFCSRLDAGRSLFSSSNLVPLITFNRYMNSTTKIQYRIAM